MTPGEGHAVVCALVGRGSRGSGGIPYVGGRSTCGVREPVLRNAAAAGSHPDVCAPPPLSGFPELPGPVGLVVGLAGAGPVGVAGVVAGLGFDELPDFPGPLPFPLPLLVWLFGFGWFVEPLFWLPELLFPELVPRVVLLPALLLPELWLPWLALRGLVGGLAGRRGRLAGLLRRTDEVDAVGGDPVGTAGLGREREEGGAVERRAGVGAVGGLEGPAEALEAGRRGGRTVGGLGRGTRGRGADGVADGVADGDPGDAVELEEPVDPEAPGEPLAVDPEGLPSALPLSPGVTEPAAPRGASAVASLARSDAWPGRAGSPGRSGRPGRSVELARAKPPEVRATTAPVAIDGPGGGAAPEARGRDVADPGRRCRRESRGLEGRCRCVLAVELARVRGSTGGGEGPTEDAVVLRGGVEQALGITAGQAGVRGAHLTPFSVTAVTGVTAPRRFAWPAA